MSLPLSRGISLILVLLSVAQSVSSESILTIKLSASAGVSVLFEQEALVGVLRHFAKNRKQTSESYFQEGMLVRSMAHQERGAGMGLDLLVNLVRWLTGGRWPHLPQLSEVQTQNVATGWKSEFEKSERQMEYTMLLGANALGKVVDLSSLHAKVEGRAEQLQLEAEEPLLTSEEQALRKQLATCDRFFVLAAALFRSTHDPLPGNGWRGRSVAEWRKEMGALNTNAARLGHWGLQLDELEHEWKRETELVEGLTKVVQTIQSFAGRAMPTELSKAIEAAVPLVARLRAEATLKKTLWTENNREFLNRVRENLSVRDPSQNAQSAELEKFQQYKDELNALTLKLEDLTGLTGRINRGSPHQEVSQKANDLEAELRPILRAWRQREIVGEMIRETPSYLLEPVSSVGVLSFVRDRQAQELLAVIRKQALPAVEAKINELSRVVSSDALTAEVKRLKDSVPASERRPTAKHPDLLPPLEVPSEEDPNREEDHGTNTIKLVSAAGAALLLTSFFPSVEAAKWGFMQLLHLQTGISNIGLSRRSSLISA